LTGKGLLQTEGRYCRYGLIPNAFPDAGADPFYNSIDATLCGLKLWALPAKRRTKTKGSIL